MATRQQRVRSRRVGDASATRQKKCEEDSDGDGDGDGKGESGGDARKRTGNAPDFFLPRYNVVIPDGVESGRVETR